MKRRETNMTLTKAQERIIHDIVKCHRAGQFGYLETGLLKPYDPRPIKALIKLGLIQAENYMNAGTYIAEITTKGWDHIYKIRPTIA